MISIQAALRKTMIDGQTFAHVNSRIYPRDVSNAENPTYPLIVVNRLSGKLNHERTAEDTLWEIIVQSKNGTDECWNIYAAIRSDINLKTLSTDDSTLHTIMVRESDVGSFFYDSTTKTYKLSARYRILTKNLR